MAVWKAIKSSKPVNENLNSFTTFEKRDPGLRALDFHAEDPGELAGFVFGCPEFNSSMLDYR